MHEALRRRCRELAASADPAERHIGQLILEADAARRAHRRPDQEAYQPSRWRHVDLADLFTHFGNVVQASGDRMKSGHEPLHGSRSGTCLVAWPTEGRWWCSSCRRSGDAPTYLMHALGVGYRDAAAWLEARYGAPTNAVQSPAATRESLRRRTFSARTP